MDTVTVDFRFTNNGAKDITGFKGEAVFTDMFGDSIKSTNLSYDNETIKAGQTKNWSGSLNYNEFIASDTKFRDVRPDKMKFAFNPISIHFSDGTKLEKAAK
ncbi:MAG: hypothetical protein PSX80_16510 [bacterium]|nr:hypothetical protein [bacterium]